MEKIEWSCLSEDSHLFAKKLFAGAPDLEEYAGMVKPTNSEDFDLVVRIVSPTGDPNRTIYIWMDEGSDPSIEFGSWHTHSDIQEDGEASIIRIVRSIQKGQRVLLHDPTGVSFGEYRVVDPSNAESLLEALTYPSTSDSCFLKSWSGQNDREIHLSDLFVE
jgi:hypothetical protein